MKKRSKTKVSSVIDSAEIIREAGFFGSSRELAELIEYAEVSSSVTYPVMIFAELGCGEEISKFGKILNSMRSGPIHIDDCRAYLGEESAFHAALFGRGDELGYFVQKANGGTLLLQNIDALSREGQVYLRGFCDEIRQERVDVRIVTTICPNVLEKPRGEVLDPGLYDRLHVLLMHLPPLRKRREDIPHLIQQYIREIALAHGEAIPAMSPDIIDILKSWPWECNHLELKTAIINLCVSTMCEKVTTDDLRRVHWKFSPSRFQTSAAV